jgi:hypothetical protein
LLANLVSGLSVRNGRTIEETPASSLSQRGSVDRFLIEANDLSLF